MIHQQLINTITELAQIPSFSGYEYRMHDYIQKFCDAEGLVPQLVADENIIIETTGIGAPIALSAHLDKINHFGLDYPQEIPVEARDSKISGLLDDAVGLGVCLHLLKRSKTEKFPPLQILLSEMEESTSVGAQRLAHHLVSQNKIPRAVVVIDVTPKFQGEPGLALYSRPWDILKHIPTPGLVAKTERLAAIFHQLCPRLEDYNNVNDYLHYGLTFSELGLEVPCFALEPSVANYHSPQEAVWRDDIIEVAEILEKMLIRWGQTEQD